MTDDIVTRLRQECEAWDCKNIDAPCLTSDAADEIERLRGFIGLHAGLLLTEGRVSDDQLRDIFAMPNLIIKEPNDPS